MLETSMRILFAVANTVQLTDVYGRPPPPDDPVASSIRSAHEPMETGLLRTTEGTEGFKGSAVVTDVAGAALFLAQETIEPVQSARSCPAINVTEFPGVRKTSLYFPLKITITEDVVVHEHVERDEETNVNSRLHSHEELVMPAESVGVSNEMITAWPLSENRL